VEVCVRKGKLMQVEKTAERVADLRRKRILQDRGVDSEMKRYHRKRRKASPWICSYDSALQRCSDKHHGAYVNYGKRGVLLLMAPDDFKTLWFRDKAYDMDRPSIDRIDNDGHYELSNCHFIELSENSRKQWTDRTPSENVEMKLKISKGMKKYLKENPRKTSPAKISGWSRKYDKCIECGGTNKKHHSHGLCEKCYKR